MRTPDDDRMPRGERQEPGTGRGQTSEPPGYTAAEVKQQSEGAICCQVCTRIADSLDALLIQIQRIADHFDPPSGTRPAPNQEVKDRGEGKKEAGGLQGDERYYTVKEAEAYLGGVVKARTLTALFNQHKLKGFRTSPRGKILIARSSLDSFRQEPPVEVKTQPELPIPKPKPKRRRSAGGEETGFQFFHLPNEGSEGS